MKVAEPQDPDKGRGLLYSGPDIERPVAFGCIDVGYRASRSRLGAQGPVFVIIIIINIIPLIRSAGLLGLKEGHGLENRAGGEQLGAYWQYRGGFGLIIGLRDVDYLWSIWEV